MFFFGGYSSILPYLLYLSVVWVCILVGIKGDIWKIFSSEDTSEQLIVANDRGNSYEDVFVIIAGKENISYTEKIFHNNYALPEDLLSVKNDQKLYWNLFTSNWQHAFKISSRSLRGPPVSCI